MVMGWLLFTAWILINGHQLSDGRTTDFVCADRTIIPKFKICDGIPDCPDRSDEDEITCGLTVCDNVGTFFCEDYRENGQCINQDLYCDGFPHCRDQSDEDEQFCKTFTCNNDNYCGQYGSCNSKDGKFTGCDCIVGFCGKRCNRLFQTDPTNSDPNRPSDGKVSEVTCLQH